MDEPKLKKNMGGNAKNFKEGKRWDGTLSGLKSPQKKEKAHHIQKGALRRKKQGSKNREKRKLKLKRLDMEAWPSVHGREIVY